MESGNRSAGLEPSFQTCSILDRNPAISDLDETALRKHAERPADRGARCIGHLSQLALGQRQGVLARPRLAQTQQDRGDPPIRLGDKQFGDKAGDMVRLELRQFGEPLRQVRERFAKPPELGISETDEFARFAGHEGKDPFTADELRSHAEPLAGADDGAEYRHVLAVTGQAANAAAHDAEDPAVIVAFEADRIPAPVERPPADSDQMLPEGGGLT